MSVWFLGWTKYLIRRANGCVANTLGLRQATLLQLVVLKNRTKFFTSDTSVTEYLILLKTPSLFDFKFNWHHFHRSLLP